MGLSQPGHVESRQKRTDVVLGQEVSDWGSIYPC